ncbi:MAG: phosphohydrolase [Candidatus Rokuibacteriota bacterium]|nr:MAG: phosphohydrolase [Candidatus Rokubacteria bacterium]
MPPMRTFHLIQVSDTHLGREQSWFAPNFRAMARIVSALRPDLVVNTGDISFDGAERDDDLAFARGCHAELDVPFRAIPGNHDVGDNPWRDDGPETITEQRLERYRRHFGEDYWLHEAGRWVLLGLNVQLFGSGMAAEKDQWRFLASAASMTSGRPIALFVHKPLFHLHAGEADVNHRFVPPDHRRRLIELLGGANVRLVASGHVHQHRRHRVGDVDHCWAPSTAFVLPDRRQPRLGTKHVGYIDYTFDEDRVDIQVVEPEQLMNHNLDDFPDAHAI